MKKKFYFVLFASCFCLSRLMAQTWQSMGPQEDPDTDQPSVYGAKSPPDMAMYNNIPYIVYKDGQNGRVTVKRFFNNAWEYVGNQGFTPPGPRVDSPSIAIDNAGIPYVAYVAKVIVTDVINVMKFVNGAWQQVGVTLGNGNSPSIAITSTGIPYVAYTTQIYNYPNPYTYTATVKYFNQGSWAGLGPDNGVFSNGKIQYLSVKMDNTNKPYIVYSDYSGSNIGQAKVMSFSNNAWSAVGTNLSTGKANNYTSLAFHKDNTPFVVYQDGTNGKGRVKGYSSILNTWADLGNLPGGDADRNTSIAIDNTGSSSVLYVVSLDPDISYYPYSNITVQKYNFSTSTWSFAGNTRFAVGSAGKPSIVISGTGTPYVSYSGGSQGKAVVKQLTNSIWTDVVPTGSTHIARDVRYNSIAIDNAGIAYRIYADASNEYKATVQKFNGTNWVSVGASAAISSESTVYTSIAIDRTTTPNTPYVIYSEGHNQIATVKKYNGNAWVNVGTMNSVYATSTEYTSIAIDKNGTPYVAFTSNLSSYGNKAVVRKFVNNAWADVGNTLFSSGAAVDLSIALDENNIPYTIYADGGNSGKATVMKLSGATWAPVGTGVISLPSSQVCISTVITMDRSVTPHIPYVIYSNSYNGGIYVQKFDFATNTWVDLNNGGSRFSVGYIQYASIDIDAAGTPYIAYQDGDYYSTEGGLPKARVKKYNKTTSMWVDIDAGGVSNGPAGEISLAVDPTINMARSGSPTIVYNSGGIFAKQLTPGPLPVTLTNFTATKDANRAKIAWSTASEQNNASFKIERSVNGEDFSELAGVAAMGDGNSTVTRQYAVYDQHPANGTTYYRLLQFDKNGDRTDYGVKALSFTLAETVAVNVYPNPVSTEINLSVENYAGKNIEAVLSDMNGHIIHQENITVNPGTSQNTYKLNLVKPAAGKYIMHVTGESLQTSFKLVIL